MRQIIDVPRVFMQVSKVDWDIDWGGQSAGGDLGGGDQVVVNAFPRFVGAPSFRFSRAALGHWRALRGTVQGRVNSWRLRLIDPVSYEVASPSLNADWAAFLAGTYVEPRPRVAAVGATLAGATAIVVDETAVADPVRVGAYLSYLDWPFLVTGRSGSGAAVTLQVQMLRVAIPDGALIDLYARGVFLSSDAMAGNPAYGRNMRTSFDMAFSEWITR